MPPRAAIVEEFDDDTDLPLPTHGGGGLANTGSRGALLEQIGVDDRPRAYADDDSDDDEEDDENAPALVPAGSSGGARAPGNMSAGGAFAKPEAVQGQKDYSMYKKWTSVYPLYIDAKRPYGTSQRRIARSKSVWYPRSHDMAEAAHRLGLSCLHETQKSHPSDWENPGRIKVLLKKDGAPVHPIVKTKRQLIERIAAQIQIMKPELVPPKPETEGRERTPKKNTVDDSDAKAVTLKSKTAQKGTPERKKNPNPRAPRPPLDLLPSLADRWSPYSPAIESGVLVEAVKASMNPSATPGAPGADAPPAIGGGGKGKRKVVRVRG